MPRSPVRNSGLSPTSPQKRAPLTVSSVQIYLRDPAPNANFRIDGPPSTRLIELNEDNNWTVRVGRATTTGIGPDEEEDNACYRSRVVSREHAYISANPDTDVITLTDTDSMHGTHVHGQRLRPNTPFPLAQEDVIVFGAAVERGDGKSAMSIPLVDYLHDEETFLPIIVEVSWEWLVEEYAPVHQTSSQSDYSRIPTQTQRASNTFAVPDLSDDEIEDYDVDDEYEVEAEPTRFTVPDSDRSDNDDSGMTSDSIISDVESPSSSPVASHHSVELATKSTSSAPIEAVQTGPQHTDQPQDNDIVVRLPSSTQSRVSIAELLEKQAESMASHHNELVAFDEPQDRYPTNDDEYLGEDFEDFSEIDDFEEEVGPVEATSTLQVPDVGLVQRDPSPSDAAMVKPVSEAVRAPPFTGQASQQEPSASINPGLVFRPESAWAGHNSVLYDAPLSVPSMSDFYRNPVPPPMPRTYAAAAWGATPLDFFNQTPAQVAATPPYSAHLPSFAQPLSRKRKAEDMEEGVDAFGPSGEAPVVKSMPAAQEGERLDDEIPLLHSVADTLKSPAPPTTDSPRKKQKTEKNKARIRAQKGTSFTKYAMTALTGAAIGAVGTVLGLAALPQDFFV